MRLQTLLPLCALLAATTAVAQEDQGGGEPVRTSVWGEAARGDAVDAATGKASLHASAPVTTLVLASYTFNAGSNCSAQGWTTVDVGPAFYSTFTSTFGTTNGSQTGDYWHVDDFAQSNSLGTLGPAKSLVEGIAFNPISGAKSMWVGKRIPPPGPVDTIHCSYVALPGYGNNWQQSFGTRNCLSVAGGATANLDVAFQLKFDVQPSYDGVYLDYTSDCTGDTGWVRLDGGYWLWSGGDSIAVASSYPVGPGPVRVRIRFASDTAWSNQDGLYPGFGAAIDNLSIEDLPMEDFEDEALGAHETADWETYHTGFGNYLALFKKTTGANYEDECTDNISCYWAALQGSTEFYTCGTPSQPAQKIVPHKNVRGEYLANDIWSPAILLSGAGNEFRLRYSVYRDLPLDNLVFHTWKVRAIPTSGCPGPWQSRGYVYYGDTKDWTVAEHSVGVLLNTSNTVAMQVAIGVVDMCPYWCGVSGSGACHSPAPYFDNVTVLRVDTVGPQWDVRPIDTFQDTFSSNGTITGVARADAAIDVKPTTSSTFTPGDSTVVLYLIDPKYVVGTGTSASGLLTDPNLSTFVGRHKTKKQAYLYVAVWPNGQPAKTGAPLSEGPGGQANRYPFAGTTMIGGVTWTKIRMDYTYRGSATNPGWGDSSDQFVAKRFNVDLNDNLFTPGDTVCYFFGATSTDGTTYYSEPYGTTTDITAVAANPMEFTILPAGGYNRGGDLLYIDGADGTTNQTYFEGAFALVYPNDKVDRYDVRDPSTGSANRPGGRVSNIAAQLNACYRHVIWDTGSLSMTLGDGSGDPLKTDDYALLNTFLAGLSEPGGVYVGGDRVAEYLHSYGGASAVTFRSSYMPFTLINDNHRLAPTSFQLSPTIQPWPGRAFSDNFVVFGGCPELNDFDVMGATGTSQVQMSYNTASSPNGAVISNASGNARMMMSGFSLALIRDNELDGILDRALFLKNVLVWQGSIPIIDPAGPLASGDALSQNYPNPFNPTTTIAFSLKARGHVALNIYDVGGRLVRGLVNDVRPAGAQDVKWDGRDNTGTTVASGVYFYRLTAPGFTQTKKMVLLK